MSSMSVASSSPLPGFGLARKTRMITVEARVLEVVAQLALEGANRGLVALVEGPLTDALRIHESGAREGLQVRGRSRLSDSELVRDEDDAHAIVDQVSVALGWEVGDGIAEPREDLQALWAGDSAKRRNRVDDWSRCRHVVIVDDGRGG